MVQGKIPQAIPLSAIKNNSRPLSTVVCYEGIYSDAVYKPWGDFLDGTARLRRHIETTAGERWLLYCEDCWDFLLAFVALLQCKKEILLCPIISPGFIANIRGAPPTKPVAPLLTDQVFSQEETPENTFHIPTLLQEAVPQTMEEAPQINADETSIILLTSGSTGKPKMVRHRLTEFEYDNRIMLSTWGEEFLKRKFCSTVSQQHVYGLLAAVLGPFHGGVPFRKKIIEFPEELEKFSDTEYVIVTVPAFLKRTVEIEKAGDLKLKSPWIMASGGFLSPEIAKKTSEVFGFWPVELYGSTETSAVAWMQSKNGPQWKPLENVRLSRNQDGCLVIRSPFVRDPEGFETADLVEILEDGRFILKGRIDSVVKIEEKRVSLTEVEGRILQSGLVSDVCVISLEDKRQYLAAAVVFNNEGKKRFEGREKAEINKFWREYLLQYLENIVIPKRWRYPQTLPIDAQGKKKKEDIKLLFAGEEGMEHDRF